MSTMHDCEVEVHTAKTDEVEKVIRGFLDMGERLESTVYEPRYTPGLPEGVFKLVVFGQTLLHGWPSANHTELVDEILKVDPEAEVTTRWHCAEGWDWDEEFGPDFENVEPTEISPVAPRRIRE